MKRFQRIALPWWASLLAAVLLAGGITLLALWCQPNALRAVLAIFRGQPLLIVLNALPVGLMLLFLAFLLGNVFWGGAVTNLIVCLLSIANHIKIQVRDEPVFPRDLALLKEVGQAMDDYTISYPVGAIVMMVAVTVILVLLGLVVGSKPLAETKRRRLLGRLLGAVVSLGVLVGLIFTVYASKPLYNSFQVSNPYYVPGVINELGFPYSFCHQFTTYPVTRPEGFDRREAEGWESGERKTGEGQPVNVLFIMNEAFSDVTDAPAFTYTPENDPMRHFHALQQDPHAITGHMVVPDFAGGTANTEFDVVTGIQTNGLSNSSTSSFRVVNRNMDSLFRTFAADGYDTAYYHPCNNWFYNRENVCRWLGAGETVFLDQMDDPDYKGRWVTDAYLVEQIQQRLAQAEEAGTPLFQYTTTIQNHMSYTVDKYGEGYVYPDVPLTISVPEEVRSMLKVYAEGVRDADAMLGQLVETFSAQEAPVVLVFYGDHLPYLGDNQLGYEALGFTQREHWAQLVSYETPYVIWANDAAAQALDWTQAVEGLDLPEDRTISAAFLGAAVVELTGRTGADPWFDFLNQLRRDAPVVQKQTVVLADGTVCDLSQLEEQPEGKKVLDQIDQWRKWSYYHLRVKEIS